jgi:predicted transcriptional regulator of viral defense system
LSAAQIHGAAHHAPQTFQVACSKHVKDRRIGRARVEFHTCGDVSRIPVAPRRVAAGDVPVSSREATALVMAAEPAWAAGIGNVANVIAELAEDDGLDSERLAAIVGLYTAAALRRVGWILANHTNISGLGTLRRAVTDSGPTASLLSPGGPRQRPVGKDWNLRINADQRSKGRDLFDLWLALTTLSLDPGEIVSASGPSRPEGLTARRAVANLRVNSPTRASGTT